MVGGGLFVPSKQPVKMGEEIFVSGNFARTITKNSTHRKSDLDFAKAKWHQTAGLWHSTERGERRLLQI